MCFFAFLQHDKNINTFKKNEGPSFPCGKQSIAWGIPTDKQRWSRVENVEDIDLTEKSSPKSWWNLIERKMTGTPFFFPLSHMMHLYLETRIPVNTFCGYYWACFYFFLEILSFCVFLITFQLHRNLYSWPVLICVCVCVLHSANKEAGTYFNEYFLIYFYLLRKPEHVWMNAISQPLIPSHLNI